MNRLSFEPAPDLPVNGIMPCIDGVSLQNLVWQFEKAAGFDNAGFYGGFLPDLEAIDPGLPAAELAKSHAVFGRTGDDSLRILECTCGIEGCSPFLCRTTVSNAVVRWDQFLQPRRKDYDYQGFGPFNFNLDQYVDALRSVMSGQFAGAKP